MNKNKLSYKFRLVLITALVVISFQKSVADDVSIAEGLYAFTDSCTIVGNIQQLSESLEEVHNQFRKGLSTLNANIDKVEHGKELKGLFINRIDSLQHLQLEIKKIVQDTRLLRQTIENMTRPSLIGTPTRTQVVDEGFKKAKKLLLNIANNLTPFYYGAFKSEIESIEQLSQDYSLGLLNQVIDRELDEKIVFTILNPLSSVPLRVYMRQDQVPLEDRWLESTMSKIDSTRTHLLNYFIAVIGADPGAVVPTYEGSDYSAFSEPAAQPNPGIDAFCKSLDPYSGMCSGMCMPICTARDPSSGPGIGAMCRSLPINSCVGSCRLFCIAR